MLIDGIIYPVYFTLWHFIIYYVAIENTPFIIDLPIQNGDFPVRYVTNDQRVDYEAPSAPTGPGLVEPISTIRSCVQ